MECRLFEIDTLFGSVKQTPQQETEKRYHGTIFEVILDGIGQGITPRIVGNDHEMASQSEDSRLIRAPRRLDYRPRPPRFRHAIGMDGSTGVVSA